MWKWSQTALATPLFLGESEKGGEGRTMRKGEAEQEVSNAFSLGEGSTLNRPCVSCTAPGMLCRWPAQSMLETGGDSRCLCITPLRQSSPSISLSLSQCPPAPAHTSPDPQGDAPGMAQCYHARCPQHQPCPQHPHFQVTFMDLQLFRYSLTVFLSVTCFWLKPDPQMSCL